MLTMWCMAFQDGNYPHHSGYVTEIGKGRGEGYTINCPLPPGSGSGAYKVRGLMGGQLDG